MGFDRVCHDFKGLSQFRDYRDASGSCSQADLLERFHCLAQQCSFDYCLHERDDYVQACQSWLPDFEAQWESAVQEKGCRAPTTGKCKRLREAATFVNSDGAAQEFERYGKAKKFAKVAKPDFNSIYDFSNILGAISTVSCDAYREIYQDAEENPEQY